eukprot:gnl/TRDRNA2_/TRDRNA2_150806_c0_seq1.p1 gnl/TRDRNA2_/TRDRNA2_150806_c0~~gnl/TRDRNA2_/TRDRNA2_150806_c0_seq1.p1  ORF type:complete len:330 (+),score=58.73 gnl/TRDRNA2_/TRDRNA2_150806_c0_seq1:3-992(+)
MRRISEMLVLTSVAVSKNIGDINIQLANRAFQGEVPQLAGLDSTTLLKKDTAGLTSASNRHSSRNRQEVTGRERDRGPELGQLGKYYNDVVESLPSLQGKCVLITGTTSGLGYWAAVATANRGASCLIMLNRDSERAKESEREIRKQAAPGAVVRTVTCDLQQISSVYEAAAQVNQIVKSWGGLDVVALNAGVVGKPDVRTADGFDIVMQTNHLSHFLLAQLLMPALSLAAAAGKEVRIVTHTSMARGKSSLTFGGAALNASYYMKAAPGSLGGDTPDADRERYHQSKFANLAFAMALHAKFKSLPQYSNFKALSAAPGWVLLTAAALF